MIWNMVMQILRFIHEAELLFVSLKESSNSIYH
jgi:hypothetical protein